MSGAPYRRDGGPPLASRGVAAFCEDEPVSALQVTPFLWLDAEAFDGVLRIGHSAGYEPVRDGLRQDLIALRALGGPWLAPRDFDFGLDPWLELRLPSARGLTFGAAWSTVPAQRPLLLVTLLRLLAQWGSVPMLARNNVLLTDEGTLALVPPFTTLVESASRTWDEWQFDEYCIAGVNDDLPQALALTCLRFAGLRTLDAFNLKSAPPSPVSMTWPSLEPLDALVGTAVADLKQARRSAPGSRAQWLAALTVLEDALASRGPLSTVVARGWKAAPPVSRWGG